MQRHRWLLLMMNAMCNPHACLAGGYRAKNPPKPAPTPYAYSSSQADYKQEQARSVHMHLRSVHMLLAATG